MPAIWWVRFWAAGCTVLGDNGGGTTPCGWTSSDIGMNYEAGCHGRRGVGGTAIQPVETGQGIVRPVDRRTGL